MDWSSWGSSWFGRWGDSWGPIQVEDVRRPKSTNTLKLQKISEGRAYLAHSKVATKSHRVQARGVVVAPVVPIVIPGGITASSSRTKTTSRVVRSRSAAKISTGAVRHASIVRALRGSSSASVGVLTTRSFSSPGIVQSSGKACALTLSTKSYTNFERLSAKGKINLSTDTIVAITLLYGRK